MIRLTDDGLTVAIVAIAIIAVSMFVRANARAWAARRELQEREAQRMFWEMRTWEGE